jgi:Cu2+-containing amine oxidase
MKARISGWTLLIVLTGVGLLLGLSEEARAGHVGAHAFCQNTSDNQALVVKKFKNGTQWSLCWEIRPNEGLIIRGAFFKGGMISGVADQERLVLYRASIAEIFVPYDDNAARYRDVTVHDALGLNTVRELTKTDCGGELLKGEHPNPSIGVKELVCQEVEDRGIAWKRFNHITGVQTVKRGEELALWSSVQTGNYNYIIRWAFWDDGTIHPQVGLTGELQFPATDHSHNVYWRFDVDLDGSVNDRVESFHHAQRPAPDLTMADDFWTPFTVEGASDWDPRTIPGAIPIPPTPDTGQSWRVMDKALKNVKEKNISYELIPNQEVLIRGAPGTSQCGGCTPEENFTNHDVWVTSGAFPRYLCELFPANNRPWLTGCSGYPNEDIKEFITTPDAEGVDGQDVILWYALHVHHRTRAEDENRMMIHWAGPILQPRDFFDKNPLAP